MSHCGLTILVGSRNEKKKEQGLAHFIEHCFFKGTKKRSALKVISRLDEVGGEINAYTTKEETSLYASFQNQYFERSIELISDILFNSTFPAKELKKEKDVVIDEIHSYLDSPSELIFDDYEDLIFRGQPIGRNILGTEKSVKSFKSKDLDKFINSNYATENMVFSVVGNISEKKLKKLLEKYFAKAKFNQKAPKREKIVRTEPISKTIKKNHYQNHCVVGNFAYGAKDIRRVPLFLLCNILGGPALNSRLGLEIREKHGYAYNVEANYTIYSDTGLFTVYFATEPKFFDKTYDLVIQEFGKLRNNKLSDKALKMAKKQIGGHIALSRESNSNLMLSYAKSLLVYNEIDSYETIYKQIENISAKDIQQVANEILQEKDLTSLIYK